MAEWKFPYDGQAYASNNDNEASAEGDSLDVRYGGGRGYYDASAKVLVPLDIIAELLRRAGWKVEAPR